MEGVDHGSAERYRTVKLLLTPFPAAGAGEERRVLHQRLSRTASAAMHRSRCRASSTTQTTVAATLDLEDLVRVVMP
jgi:hypothetical protein